MCTLLTRSKLLLSKTEYFSKTPIHQERRSITETLWGGVERAESHQVHLARRILGKRRSTELLVLSRKKIGGFTCFIHMLPVADMRGKTYCRLAIKTTAFDLIPL